MSAIKTHLILCLFFSYVVIFNCLNAQVLPGGGADPGGGSPPSKKAFGNGHQVNPFIEKNEASNTISTELNKYFPKYVANEFPNILKHEQKLLKIINEKRMGASKNFSNIIEVYNFLYLEFLIEESTQLNTNQLVDPCNTTKSQYKLINVFTKKAKSNLKALLKDHRLDEYLHLQHQLTADEISIFKKNMNQLINLKEYQHEKD